MALPAEAFFLIDLLAIFSIYLVVNLSLNLEFGYAGVPNFGKVLSVGTGAFVAGSLPGRIFVGLAGIKGDYIADNVAVVTAANLWLQQNILTGFAIFLITLALALVIGAAVGFLASYPAIRLREDYLAITLLALGEIIRIVGINYSPIAGGTLGVQTPDPLAWLPGELRFPVATLGLIVFAAAVLIYSERLVRSPLGRMLRAIRDSEVAAASLGKDTTTVRTKIILLSSALGALGGALYAFYVGGVIAFGYNRVNWTFWPFVMVLLGGAANNKGVAVGTFVFVAVRKLISFYKGALGPFVPFDVVWLDLMLLGAVLLAVLMFLPQGIFAERSTYTIDPERYRRSKSGG